MDIDQQVLERPVQHAKTLHSRANPIFETRVSRMTLETRLVQAHVMLMVIPLDEHESKSVPLARYGPYEIRLVELAGVSNAFVFWLELFDHNCQMSVDSGGANDLEDALILAEYLISRAAELNKNDSENYLAYRHGDASRDHAPFGPFLDVRAAHAGCRPV